MLSPLAAPKWNFTTAAHLLNRAGFGGAPAEIEALAQLGPERAVAKLVDYEEVPDPTPDPEWAKPDPSRRERFQALRQASPEERKTMQREERQKQFGQLQELRGWWLKRMANGPRPLQEKLTLFWHGHFATSAQKVRDAYLMWVQNDTFRRHASGNWLELLLAVTKDPAMLIWLDQGQSRREHPNENYAREVMELFALGEGHYTEKDIAEAARALTGLTLDRIKQEFVYRERQHDDGAKTVLGRAGDLNWTDVIRQIVAQPQAARFITAKLWSFFVSENPSDEVVTALAAALRQAGNQFKPVLRLMFRSEEFYADSVIRSQVKSPVQWLVGSVRMLERDLPPRLLAAGALRQLGQDLFAPPNVKGWDGGTAWITTNSLLNRYNFAATLVLGRAALPLIADAGRAQRFRERLARVPRKETPVDVNRLFTADERESKERLVGALERRLLQAKMRPNHSAALWEYLNAEKDLNDFVILNSIRLVMSSPEFQLT